MLGIPKTIDLSQLLQEVITQICFGQWQVIIRFGDTKFVSIESPFWFEYQAGVKTQVSGPLIDACPILSPIGDSLMDWTITGQGELELVFSGGLTMGLSDHNKNAESFQISIGEELIFV